MLPTRCFRMPNPAGTESNVVVKVALRSGRVPCGTPKNVTMSVVAGLHRDRQGRTEKRRDRSERGGFDIACYSCVRASSLRVLLYYTRILLLHYGISFCKEVLYLHNHLTAENRKREQ